MMDIGTVPKHAEFHFQNKFEKLVLLGGFIIRKLLGSVDNKLPVSKVSYPIRL
jgi:hypothetical protein